MVQQTDFRPATELGTLDEAAVVTVTVGARILNPGITCYHCMITVDNILDDIGEFHGSFTDSSVPKSNADLQIWSTGCPRCRNAIGH
jgi:hypothetical protein